MRSTFYDIDPQNSNLDKIYICLFAKTDSRINLIFRKSTRNPFDEYKFLIMCHYTSHIVLLSKTNLIEGGCYITLTRYSIQLLYFIDPRNKPHGNIPMLYVLYVVKGNMNGKIIQMNVSWLNILSFPNLYMMEMDEMQRMELQSYYLECFPCRNLLSWKSVYMGMVF